MNWTPICISWTPQTFPIKLYLVNLSIPISYLINLKLEMKHNEMFRSPWISIYKSNTERNWNSLSKKKFYFIIVPLSVHVSLCTSYSDTVCRTSCYKLRTIICFLSLTKSFLSFFFSSASGVLLFIKRGVLAGARCERNSWRWVIIRDEIKIPAINWIKYKKLFIRLLKMK